MCHVRICREVSSVTPGLLRPLCCLCAALQVHPGMPWSRWPFPLAACCRTTRMISLRWRTSSASQTPFSQSLSKCVTPHCWRFSKVTSVCCTNCSEGAQGGSSNDVIAPSSARMVDSCCCPLRYRWTTLQRLRQHRLLRTSVRRRPLPASRRARSVEQFCFAGLDMPRRIASMHKMSLRGRSLLASSTYYVVVLGVVYSRQHSVRYSGFAFVHI